MTRINGKRLAAGVLALSLAAVPMAGHLSAQTAADRTGTDAGTATTRTSRDDGFNPGWLGLLGLGGLLGLMPRKTHAVTTHRVGDANVR
jgi:hypothetical protein